MSYKSAPFKLFAKKGQRVTGYLFGGVDHSFETADWTLESSDGDETLPIEPSRGGSVNIEMEPKDYTKTDEVKLVLWLDVPEEDEGTLSSRTLSLSTKKFDASVTHRSRANRVYLARSIQIQCTAPAK